MASSSTRKGKGKSSQITIQITGKGSEAYKDIDWKTLSDDEARAIEKEASLAWKVLSNTQTQALQDASVEDVEKKLSEILKLTNSEIDLSESVLLDYYVCGFWWAKERGFTTQQLSGFFTVLHTLLENIREKQLSLADNLSEFRKMLVGIGADNNSPSKGLDFFDLEHAKAITDFLQGTLFQHHKMYEFLFHSERTEEIVGTELVVEVLPPAAMPYPPPLDEGLSEEVYLRHVAPPPPTPTPEPQPQEEDTEEEAGTDIKSETPKLIEEQVGAAEAASLVQPEALLASVTAEEVKTMFDRVSKELFAGLQSEISEKLLEREAEIIGRINKIHRVAEA
ncbi:ciliary-associated calcium-binding coiled-coil protein 1-like isoform X2 [Patiria miniata]|uniref:Ciliary associated calcium binding coiled-coil 1 n=1 Tax=Patiria miniata TaxID=46514 RepID=A0A913Z6A3_PATMI|nr:ciliary-associated calcium-binding coiled-coil protein 1-like isoform X2 [Patiria miniata]